MFKVEHLFIFIMILSFLGNLQNSNAEQKVEVDDSSNMILPAETKGKSKAYRRLVDPYPVPPIDIVDTYPKNLEINFHTDISVLDTEVFHEKENQYNGKSDKKAIMPS